jgi:hypothetical protein
MISENELLEMKAKLSADVIDDAEEFLTWLVVQGVELIDEVLSYRHRGLMAEQQDTVATLKLKSQAFEVSLGIALTALTHYRRSGTWSHIAADALEIIKRCLQGTQVDAEIPIAVSEMLQRFDGDENNRCGRNQSHAAKRGCI